MATARRSSRPRRTATDNHHGIQNLGLKYRPDDEVLAWKERDPITSFEDRMMAGGRLTREQLDAVWADARGDIEAAIEFLSPVHSPQPSALLLAGVYTEAGV